MFEIYSKSDCPFCDKAKAYFSAHHMAYVEHCCDDIEVRTALYDWLRLVHPHRTVPQIFSVAEAGRSYVGGYSDLIRADFPGRLQMENFDAEF